MRSEPPRSRPWPELLADDAAFGACDEGEKCRDFGVHREPGIKRFQGFGEVDVLFEEELFVCGAECANVLIGEASALQSDLVNAADGGGIAIHDGEGRDVLHDFGDPPGDGMGSDAAKLMDGGEAGDDGEVGDVDVAGEGAIVGKDDVVADLAIVCDVRIGKAEVI